MASLIGSLSGMGGGVIIKPVLDFFNVDSLNNITFYSSVAVFTMTISSTYKQYKNGIHFNVKKATVLSVGSLLGGVLGNRLFYLFLKMASSQEQVQAIQYCIMLITLVLALLCNHFSEYHLSFTSLYTFFLVGTVLGSVSTFLGIGGGPINVACLVFFFGMNIKSATLYSIITIFFSQLAKLVMTGVYVGFSSFNITIIWMIVPAALVGGYLGGIVSKHLTEKLVTLFYNIVVLFVIILNLYNLYTVL